MDMKPYTDTELDSLIRLLADDDATTLSMVTARLLGLGDRIVPALWDARASVSEPIRMRIDGILGRLSPEAGSELAWEDWRGLVEQPGEVDLERGVAAIARLRYPDLDWAPYTRMLDRMADELAVRLVGVSDPIDTVETVSGYLFQDQGFQGRNVEYLDPHDQFINRVLDRKQGIPIAITTVCLLVARRLKLPIYGVNLPQHFIAKYGMGDVEVLFDPYHGGAIISREECEAFVISLRLRFSDDLLAPASNRIILFRMLNNLSRVYTTWEDRGLKKRLQQYIRLIAGE